MKGIYRQVTIGVSFIVLCSLTTFITANTMQKKIGYGRSDKSLRSTLGIALASESVQKNIKLPEKAVIASVNKVPRPKYVRGLYSTGWVAGLAKRFDQLINIANTTEVNALVIDVKDDTGTTSHETEIKLAMEIGAVERKVKDLPALVRKVAINGIYPIARIVVFKDPVLSKKRPDLAIKDSTGNVWRDKKGLTWVNPYQKEVWKYNVDLAKEAAKMGFSEIQFDYVRFPDVPEKVKRQLYYAGSGGATNLEAITGFLKYAMKELKPYNVVVSADIFGLVATAKDDLGIGQRLEEFSEIVDYLCPMVYPSHYAKGEYGISNPNASPYQTVWESLKDATERIKAAGTKAKIIPWLQDFSLGYPYGKNEILAQIKAARDLGIHEWLMWNPSNKYTVSAFSGPSGDDQTPVKIDNYPQKTTVSSTLEIKAPTAKLNIKKDI